MQRTTNYPIRFSAILYCSLSNCARLWLPSESTDATELWKMFGTVSISIFDLLWPGNALSRIVWHVIIRRQSVVPLFLLSFREQTTGDEIFVLFNFFFYIEYIYIFFQAASYLFTTTLCCKRSFNLRKKKTKNKIQQWRRASGRGEKNAN